MDWSCQTVRLSLPKNSFEALELPFLHPRTNALAAPDDSFCPPPRSSAPTKRLFPPAGYAPHYTPKRSGCRFWFVKKNDDATVSGERADYTEKLKYNDD